MTPREQAAFVTGIETARQMAMPAALTIEVRDDAREVRKQAAAAALQVLAAELKATFLDSQPSSTPERRIMAMIVNDTGTMICPAFKGRPRPRIATTVTSTPSARHLGASG